MSRGGACPSCHLRPAVQNTCSLEKSPLPYVASCLKFPPLEFICLAEIINLLYNYTSISGRKCAVVIGRAMDEIIYQVPTDLSFIEVADSLGSTALRESDGSPGSFQCDGKAFIQVALLSWEVAASLSHNWSSQAGRRDTEQVLEGEQTCFALAQVWVWHFFHLSILAWMSLSHITSSGLSLTSCAWGQRPSAPGGRGLGSLTFSALMEIDKGSMSLAFMFLFPNCCQPCFTQDLWCSDLSIPQNHLQGS